MNNKIVSRFKKVIFFVNISVLGIFAFAFTTNYGEISKNIDIFITIYKEVNNHYVDEVESGKLMKTGIDAMLKSLDPYTTFISESEIEDYRISITGEYAGIGTSTMKRGENTVFSEVYEGFPAQLNDVRAGDVIISIDGKEVKGRGTDEIGKSLRGQAGSEIKLVLKRGDKQIEKTFKRGDIKVKNVPYYGMLTSDIAYIALAEFRNDAGRDVGNALEELKKTNKVKGVVLDLRGNPGGLLREAVEVVNVFVPRNQLVVQAKGKQKEEDYENRTLRNAIDEDIPLVVLINKGSASASEIVSGTIQDLDRGVIVGQKSFGKGLVQQTKPLSFGNQLKITTQKYYIPSGRCIQAVDYSKKDENGKGTRIADSLHRFFKTKNGRKVEDGNGITPDVKVNPVELSDIANSLLRSLIIFDYATNYRNSHETIAGVTEFKLSEEDWKNFLAYAKEKEGDYKTASEKMLEDLKKKSEEEKTFSTISAQYDQLKNQFLVVREKELTTRKAEIMNQLEKEILSRYYFQKSEYQSQVNRDADVIEAIAVLNDMNRYKSLLK